MPAYEADLSRFAEYDAQVLGMSTDPVPSVKAWAESLDGISYPMLSDFWPHGEVARKYGVLRDDGMTERAIFVIDKQGIVLYIDVHDITEMPDPEDIFEQLRKL